MKIVCKFGGSSLACRENIERCADIIRSDANRKYIVVSAPGKKGENSRKITDLLYDCFRLRSDKTKLAETFAVVKARFRENILFSDKSFLDAEFDDLYDKIQDRNIGPDYVLSRGEYFNAKILSKYLGYDFLDAAEFVRFRKGELDMSATLKAAKKIDKNRSVVIPGFYGTDEFGNIKTFSRGGSDISGSVVARAFDCDLYENWTDVDGIHVCDPRVIKNSKKVEQVSFRELREMSYMGASVLHAETLLPIYDKPIPIVIKNSFDPSATGTRITKKRTDVSDKDTITCITGKNDYTCIQISKMMLDKQLGFVKKATTVFEEYNLNISHTHSGLDNLCFFVERSEYVKISFEEFLKVLQKRIKADNIKGYENIALLAVIGHNLSGKVGIVAKIFGGLKEKRINVKTIYQSISECNIIIGIENGLLKDGIMAIYNALMD